MATSTQQKYQPLVDLAQQLGFTNLKTGENNGVYYIEGTAPNGQTKDAVWEAYNKIDPDYKSGDLILDVKVDPASISDKAEVDTDHSNLNIRKGPGVDQPIVGKAAKGEIVDVLNKSNDEWWLIRTKDGEEGYAYSRYLRSV